MNTNTTTNLREMTNDELQMFVLLNDSTAEIVIKMFNKLEEHPGGWVLRAIKKRFEAYNIKVDNKTMIMILTIGVGAVGKCVKYVDDIAVFCKDNSKTKIDFKTFTEIIYPHGFPVF